MTRSSNTFDDETFQTDSDDVSLSDDEEEVDYESGSKEENNNDEESEEGFEDEDSDDSEEDDEEESGSDDGSNSDEDESLESEEGSAGPESEVAEYVEKNDREPFMNEQEALRGIGDSSSNNSSRRMYVICLSIFCVILLAVAIGLGVGLSRKSDKDNEKDEKGGDLAPAPVSTLPLGSAPTNPPVRMPISLPNAPKINGELETVDVEVFVEASGDTTIYRDGDSMGDANGSKGNMLVQGGSATSNEISSAYSLVELSLDTESIQYILAEGRSATFCLEHVPNDENSDRIVTYSACLIEGDALQDIESLTGDTANYDMPFDCLNFEIVNFDVRPADTKICMDVTNTVFESLLSSNGRRGLRGSSRGSNQRSLQGSQKNLVMMIDNLLPSDEPGDRFFTSNNEDSENPPSLTIEGEKNKECTTIGDLVCSDSRFSMFCDLTKNTQLKKMLGDSRSSFTLFAPTDEAITNALAKDIDPTDTDFLEDLFLYHIVFTQLQSKNIDCDLPVIPPLRMANGAITNIQCVSAAIFVVGGGNTGDELPKVIEADIGTCNGIVHAIDEVILPASESLKDTDNNAINVDEDCVEFGTLVCTNEELVALCQFTTLFGNDPLLGEVFETLSTGVFTIFLPNNAAALELQNFDLTDSKAIVDILMHHVVPDVKIDAEDLECDGELQMVTGGTTTTVCEGDSLFQVGKGNVEAMPRIVEADIKICTGVVHIVDKIIQPGSRSVPDDGDITIPGDGGQCQTFGDLVCSEDDLTVLCSLVEELSSTPDGALFLNSIDTSPYTVFAPSNNGLSAFLEDIDTNDMDAVSNLLLFHMTRFKLFAEDLVCDQELTMKNGETTTTQCNNNGKIFQVGGGNSQVELPKITKADIYSCMGIVHVVNQVILQ